MGRETSTCYSPYLCIHQLIHKNHKCARTSDWTHNIGIRDDTLSSWAAGLLSYQAPFIFQKACQICNSPSQSAQIKTLRKLIIFGNQHLRTDHLFLKKRFYLYLERREGREKGRETSISCLLQMSLKPGMCPDLESNWWPFTWRDANQLSHPV